jgi:hypothetical protein
MTIKIEVKSAEIYTKTGTSARTGKPYSIREQDAYAHICDRDGKPQPYPVKIKLMLGDQQSPHAPGNYQLSDTSFWVDRFAGLSITPVLVPLAARAA